MEPHGGSREAARHRRSNPAKTIGAACEDAAVVFTMLADDAALIDVVSGGENDPGIAEALGEGDVHVSLSTISTDLSARLAEAHADAGSTSSPLPCSAGPKPRKPAS